MTEEEFQRACHKELQAVVARVLRLTLRRLQDVVALPQQPRTRRKKVETSLGILQKAGVTQERFRDLMAKTHTA